MKKRPSLNPQKLHSRIAILALFAVGNSCGAKARINQDTIDPEHEQIGKVERMQRLIELPECKEVEKQECFDTEKKLYCDDEGQCSTERKENH